MHTIKNMWCFSQCTATAHYSLEGWVKCREWISQCVCDNKKKVPSNPALVCMCACLNVCMLPTNFAPHSRWCCKTGLFTDEARKVWRRSDTPCSHVLFFNHNPQISYLVKGNIFCLYNISGWDETAERERIKTRKWSILYHLMTTHSGWLCSADRAILSYCICKTMTWHILWKCN